jgi:ribonuclease HI
MNNTIEIYTDAGYRKGTYGCGAFIIIGEEEFKWGRKYKQHEINKALGINNAGTTHAEMLSVMFMINHMLLMGIRGMDIVFYVDCDSIYAAANRHALKYKSKRKNTSHTYITNKYLRMLEKLKLSNNVDIRWVPAHRAVYGNSIADSICSGKIKNKTKFFHSSLETAYQLDLDLIQNIT